MYSGEFDHYSTVWACGFCVVNLCLVHEEFIPLMLNKKKKNVLCNCFSLVKLFLAKYIVHSIVLFLIKILPFLLQLEACAHPFFDELREPNARLPNGRPLPPLFNFKQEVCLQNL